ncbi:MAG TPA: MFS transporter [Gammaproteobacteria bacterium]|nr:MFS transporter [Gammaproteobacteria bacterium]
MAPDQKHVAGTLRPDSLLVFVMAAACGLAVASLYYAQPLLDTLARSLDVSTANAGFIVTMTQLGYATGLVLLVPLGDLVERRRLITRVSAATALSLAAAGMAPSYSAFLGASLAIGVTAVVAQVLVPFAAHLAADRDRGRVVGRVMSGLLLGILLARVASGIVADVLGWRAVFWMAAVLMLAQSAVLARVLPTDRGESRLSYGALLLSVLHLVRDEPLLRRRIVYGMSVFAAFSVLWTSLPFLLAPAPYGYSDSAIGAFGLLGVAGALCASFAGHLHDHGHSRLGTGTFLSMIVVSFALLYEFPQQLVAVILGIVLLDLGVQGTQILNQSAIYQLRSDARSRITTAYMTCYFIGGAIGSAAASASFAGYGWSGVALSGGAFGALGVAVWLTEWPATANRASAECD